MTRSGKTLKRATNVVRPAQISEDPPAVPNSASNRQLSKKINYWKDKELMIQVFQRFSVALLNKSLSVCKEWNQMILTPHLWRDMDLTHQ